MTLGGHSMGGYLSVAYCEKYPQHVERLILISPAGVPDDREVDIKGRLKDAPLKFRLAVGVVSKFFHLGVTPSSFLRKFPEKRGRAMVQRYVEGRLPAITCPDEKTHLTDYLYTNAMLPGSGEDCLNKILKPTTFAHKPTLHRIPLLQVKNVSFIYGQNDWMDANGGIQTMEKCDELRKEAGKGDTPHVHVYGVRNAGHLLMLENWKEFNSAIALATGRGGRLSSHAPMPYDVKGPESAGRRFFAPPRWARKDADTVNDGGEQRRPATA
eukprot:CAMPEP_0197235182 /NCGR_PEP_ID=MMETSP1429-20130617/2678_1 /TAXON_ID=49237 /ORGANISM="Chaetoceros  sp., Strain UNC1202" /LENGTH=268 /DNA_ID=CAMNT_0042693717 /DNA_START=191 /DNA_END=997 /DNA_ORIENTATION=-